MKAGHAVLTAEGSVLGSRANAGASLKAEHRNRRTSGCFKTPCGARPRPTLTRLFRRLNPQIMAASAPQRTPDHGCFGASTPNHGCSAPQPQSMAALAPQPQTMAALSATTRTLAGPGLGGGSLGSKLNVDLDLNLSFNLDLSFNLNCGGDGRVSGSSGQCAGCGCLVRSTGGCGRQMGGQEWGRQARQ